MKKTNVRPIPEGYRTITPHLVVRNAAKALEWYQEAFGAVPMVRMEIPGGKIVHCDMKIGDSMVMMSDEMPEMASKSPESLGGVPGGIMMYVPDVDAAFARAVKAGAKTLMPVADQFWGDRYGKLADPFGHIWALATRLEDVSEPELKKRQAEMFGSRKA